MAKPSDEPVADVPSPAEPIHREPEPDFSSELEADLEMPPPETTEEPAPTFSTPQIDPVETVSSWAHEEPETKSQEPPPSTDSVSTSVEEDKTEVAREKEAAPDHLTKSEAGKVEAAGPSRRSSSRSRNRRKGKRRRRRR
jgi:hypothetical protein